MHLRTALTLPILACLLAAPAAAQQEAALSPEERRIAAYLDDNADEHIALLRRIVDINSGTFNPEGVRAVHEQLAPELARLGFEVEYVEQPPAMGRGGHLVARLRPAGPARGPKLLLIGHLDTVFEEDSPFQRFELVDDSTARGPGVEDMKGGDVVIVAALEALHSAGALEGMDITVVMTGDEEDPGDPLEQARSALIDAGRHADVALGFEGGSRDEDGTAYGVVARRSSTGWRLDVRARAAHSSVIFQDEVGAGAVFEAARILNRFYGEVRGEEFLTFNVGLVLGGTEVEFDQAAARGRAFGKTNVIPGGLVATGGIRTISDEQLQRTRERMRGIVEDALPHAEAEITFYEGYPAMSPTEANHELLALYGEVSEALGLGGVKPFDPARRGAADISFVAPHVDAALDGLGVYGSGGHTVRETVELPSIALQAKRAALLMYRLTR